MLESKTIKLDIADATYSVVTYQIPVPLGDYSVHLLVRNGVKVLKAFLMDGDTSSGGFKASKAIDTAVKIIYDEWKDFPIFQLDSWIATHRDEDHYQGIINLFFSDSLKGPLKDPLEGPKCSKGYAWFADDRHLLCGAHPAYTGKKGTTKKGKGIQAG